jgi:dTMP kinase
MSRRLKKGLLVVIEGIDGAGKTTQCERLARKLREEGWDVERLREPTDGPYGRRIRELARLGRDGVTPEDELTLFIEDRRENVTINIMPALERGAIALLDRYYYSTIAYQGARGLDAAEIRRRNEEFAPVADLLFYIQIPVEITGARIENGERKGGRDLFEKEDYLRHVKAIFDEMPDAQKIVIDGTKTVDSVFEAIWGRLKELLDDVETTH